MDNGHIRQLIPDYVLDLLDGDAAARVEQHARQCDDCREAIRRERQIEALLRQTIHVAARPAPARLVQLRPSPPRRIDMFRERLYRQLAPATMFAALALFFLLVQAGGLGAFQPAYAQTARPPVAATSTQTPTATLAGAGLVTDEARTPAPSPDGAPSPYSAGRGSPAPAATPIISYTP